MKKSVQKEDLIYRFLKELSNYGYEIANKIEQQEENNITYSNAENLLNLLAQSKVKFATMYYNMSGEEKRNVYNILLDVYNDLSAIEDILSQTLNLYYLYKEGLYEEEFVAPQRDESLEALTDLENNLRNYLESIQSSQIEDITKLEEEMDKILTLGTIYESGEQDTIIDDVEFLQELLDKLNLAEEDELSLLAQIILRNNELYEQNIIRRQQTITAQIEESKSKTEKDITSPRKKTFSISSEVIQEIDKLLSDRDVVEKIVRIINDDIKFLINISKPSKEEQEKIKESVSLAREDIIDRITSKEGAITPYEALEEFYIETEQTKTQKIKLIEDIFSSATESQLDEDDQRRKIEEGISFYEQYKYLIKQLSQEEKEIINHYMVSIYNDPINRETIYGSKSYSDNMIIEQEAAYELEVLKSLLEDLDKDSPDYRVIISKISKRIEDILDCVYKFIKPHEDESTVASEESGNIFFIMRNNKKSLVEDDIKLEDKNKGISSVYYSDIQEQFNDIRNRSRKKISSIVPDGVQYKTLRKLGANYTRGARTRVLYIPVGKSDAIILGINFITGHEFDLKDQDARIKKYIPQIEALKENLKNEEAYLSELEKSQEVQQRLISYTSSFKDERTEEEIFKDMFSDGTEEIKKR